MKTGSTNIYLPTEFQPFVNRLDKADKVERLKLSIAMYLLIKMRIPAFDLAIEITVEGEKSFVEQYSFFVKPSMEEGSEANYTILEDSFWV